MANIFTRIKNAIEADLHDVLDKKEQKNPIKSLNQYLRQAEIETEKVRKLIERQYKLKDEFTKEFDHAKELADKRSRQAKIAETANEAEMYQFAIREYEEYQGRADRMEISLQKVSEQLDHLEQKYEEMKHRLKDMHLRRMDLMGRENVAHANHQMNQVLESVGERPFSKFAEMERYIEGLEHKVNSSYYRSTFDYKIANLEKELSEKSN